MSADDDTCDYDVDTEFDGDETRTDGQASRLPDLGELIQGKPYLHCSLKTDIEAWVLSTRDRWGKLDDALPTMLDGLLTAPSRETCREAGDALAVATEHLVGDELAHEAHRPHFYAATMGCTTSALHVAKAAMHLAMTSSFDVEARRELVEAALGWLMVTKFIEPVNPAGRQFRTAPRLRAKRMAGVAVAWLTGKPYGQTSDQTTVDVAPPWRRAHEAKTRVAEGVVVIRTVGNPGTSTGEKVRDELRPMLGVTLPLTRVPDLLWVRTTLAAEFPHLNSIIGAILSDLERHGGTWFQPVLLNGDPGTGKSRFATRFLEELRLSPVTYGCGGVADASLAGTARRWESSEPSVPLARVIDTRTANPGVVLDEVEKASQVRRNGNLMDALLGLLERQTSATWLDPYIQAQVDLSHVCWIGTANSVEEMPAPLRDRFRTFRVPAPGAEHVEAIANSLVRATVAARGLDLTWARPLDGVELHGLQGVWKGGSIRSLSRYVQTILDARERPLGGWH